MTEIAPSISDGDHLQLLQSENGEEEKQKIDISEIKPYTPFNMNHLFKISFNFDEFKIVLDEILRG